MRKCHLFLLLGPTFNWPHEKLFDVFDKKIKNLQSRWLHSTGNNVLSTGEFARFFSNRSHSKGTPQAYRTRLVFVTGILTSMRPAVLWSLTVHQFVKIKTKGDKLWIVIGSVGSLRGSSKNILVDGVQLIKDSRWFVYEKRTNLRERLAFIWTSVEQWHNVY